MPPKRPPMSTPGLPQLPSNPMAPLASPKIMSTELLGIDDDMLDTRDGPVERPCLLRKALFDGKTHFGLSYVYDDDNTRTVTDESGNSWTETLEPPYYVGEELVLVHSDRGLVDANTAGRSWRGSGTAVLYGKTTAEHTDGNVLTLTPCNADGSAFDPVPDNISVYATFPPNNEPIGFEIADGAVLAYMPIPSLNGKTGVLFPADANRLPKGNATGDMIMWTEGETEEDPGSYTLIAKPTGPAQMVCDGAELLPRWLLMAGEFHGAFLAEDGVTIESTPQKATD